MMTEKDYFAPTLTEQNAGPQQTEQEDDGETIVRGENYVTISPESLSEDTIRAEAEKLHEEAVTYLTQVAEQLAR